MKPSRHHKTITTLKSQRAADTTTIHVERDPNYPVVNILHEEGLYYDYRACPRLMEFLAEDVGFKVLLGPYGSGKTSGVMKWSQHRSLIMPVCDDGVRRYKITFIRNTTQDLQTTTLPTFLNWLKGWPPMIGRKSIDLAHNKEFKYQFNDKFGTIEFMALFLPLDGVDSLRKLDSLETTDVYVEEARHISKGVVDKAEGRTGRYPPKSSFLNLAATEFNKVYPDKSFDIKSEGVAYEWFKKWYPYKSYLLAASNAPNERHWIYDYDKKPVKGAKVYHQPPALIKDKDNEWVQNKDCDNIAYQSPNYWLKMIKNGDTYVRVYACGDYGLALEGKLVHPEFNPDLHICRSIDIDKTLPILLTLDVGLNALTPAGLISQFTNEGVLKHLEEFITDRESTRGFLENHIVPALSQRYAGLQLLVVFDPAGLAGKNLNSGERLSPDELIKDILGVEGLPAKTNSIHQRLEAQKYFLTKLVGSPAKAAFQIDASHCPVLVEGFTYKYIYGNVKIAGEDKLKELPLKIHPHSDVMDSSQYACCEFGGTGLRQAIAELDTNAFRYDGEW